MTNVKDIRTRVACKVHWCQNTESSSKSKHDANQLDLFASDVTDLVVVRDLLVHHADRRDFLCLQLLVLFLLRKKTVAVILQVTSMKEESLRLETHCWDEGKLY